MLREERGIKGERAKGEGHGSKGSLGEGRRAGALVGCSLEGHEVRQLAGSDLFHGFSQHPPSC